MRSVQIYLCDICKKEAIQKTLNVCPKNWIIIFEKNIVEKHFCSEKCYKEYNEN